MSREDLLKRLEDKTALVGVIGLGYVGLPLAVEFADAGYTVIGVDPIAQKVEMVNNGESYIPDVPTERLAPLVAAGKLKAFTGYDVLAEADTALITVPTPLRKTKDPDMSYIYAATDSLQPYMHKDMIVVLESTTYPGTTEEIIVPRLSKDVGLTVGEDVFIAFSPERVDPGNPVYQTHNTPKVVGGMTPACVEVAVALYEQAIETVVPVSSPRAAEMVKLLENTFRAVNIGLVNEMAIMCDKLDVNVWEVINAAKTKPFGFMAFYPGPGLGGHCIPIDPLYLSWKLKSVNYTARFIELASEINTNMPYHVIRLIMDALNDVGKPLKGSHVAVLGVAYKRDIDDVRESPALDIIHLLGEKGAHASYHDPYVPSIRIDGGTMSSDTLTEQWLSSADCVVIVTDHSDFDYDWIVEHSQLVVDTRNATQGVADKAKIVIL